MNENNVAVTVEVPRYEYARLIRDSERLRVLTKLSKELDNYDLHKVMDILFMEQEDD